MKFEKQTFSNEFDNNVKRAESLKELFQKVAGTPEAISVFEESMRLWQNPENAVWWWSRPNRTMDNISPLEYLAVDPVKRAPEIKAIISRIEHGVYF